MISFIILKLIVFIIKTKSSLYFYALKFIENLAIIEFVVFVLIMKINTLLKSFLKISFNRISNKNLLL